MGVNPAFIEETEIRGDEEAQETTFHTEKPLDGKAVL